MDPVPRDKEPLSLCPACDSPMSVGYVIASREIIWSKKPQRVIVSPKSKNGDRIIAPFSPIKIAHQGALCCQNCGVVITFSSEVK